MRRMSALLVFSVCLFSLPGYGAETQGFASALRQLLGTPRHPYLTQADLGPEIAELRAFYGGRAHAPAWTQANGASVQGESLLAALRDAASHGLRPADYDLALIERRLHEARSAGGGAPARAAMEVALAATAVRFARHLHYGRVDPALAGFDLTLPRPALDVVGLLERLAGGADPAAEFAAIEPRFHHYHLLKAALVRYRRLARDATWVRLPPFNGKSVKPGELYAGAALLRQRLVALGDLAADTDAGQAAMLDPILEAALRRFQERHGLTVDGTLGQHTLAALNTPLAVRVEQIELTLERWRWLGEIDSPPIVVNIPQFRLFAFQTKEDREAGMLNMEVVVGEDFPEKRTPIFLEDLRYVVFRPYWNVPHGITRRELLPQIRARPDYLAKHHMEIVRGDGDSATVMPATAENLDALARGQLRLRQRPGAHNALGEIKFMLPNPYDVYLHSTPARALFKQARRAFSHGCIRVSDPVALAAYVLRDEPGDWDEDRIRAAMNGAPNHRVTLTRPIPVMILYGTALAAESGRVYFFEDIYGHDARLRRLLERSDAAPTAAH